MDRRKRKTREAIFNAFTELLSEKRLEQITVGEIINRADIGRATFYSHFETKDFLLREFCEELFCHIFDSINNETRHRHIFDCDAHQPVFLHLFSHILNNDNNVLKLLSCRNNDVFLRYFKEKLKEFAEKQSDLFLTEKNRQIPDSFFNNVMASIFVETIIWWIDNGKKETPEKLTEYFLEII